MSSRKVSPGLEVSAFLLILAVAAPLLSAEPSTAPVEMKATVVVGPDGKPQVIQSGAQPMPGQGPPGMRRPMPTDRDPSKKPGDAPAEKDKEKKPDEKEKADNAPKPVVRPEKPPKAPNPDELKLRRPDANGKISFSFRGQPWPAVLDWLADVSGMNLDWQELPGDYLNLTTPRPYTVDEARDVINRHLLARGYTMLLQDRGLSVVKVKEMNPALAPRVSPEELADRSPNEFVKVCFPLETLLAEDTAKELEPLLSPNGKLTPLKATNRIEAMDAVVNLREIHSLLLQEQSDGGQGRLVREFELRYARAEEVCQQLLEMLGSASKSSPSPGPSRGMNPDQMRMMQEQQQQQMAMAAQQQQQQGGRQPSQPPAPKATVSILANRRKNSVLVHAPADKMAIVAAAVKLLDVPTGGPESLQAYTGRMQVYRLAAIDPKQLAAALEEMGNLDPTTRLKVDERNKSILADASLADHLTIRTLIEKLDASGRQFEVVPLRRLEAAEVAGTIEMMMGAGDRDKQSSRNRNDYYMFGYSSRGRESEESTDKFRVSANLEQNQLLLWCNDVEFREVENLLAKLGEYPAQGGNASTIRVIDAGSAEEREALLKRLREVWPSLGPNQLKLISPSQEEPQQPSRDGEAVEKATRKPAAPQDGRAAADRSASEAPAGQRPPRSDFPSARPIVRLVQFGGEEPSPAQAPPSGQPPPIQITVGPDGRLILTCQDPKALDLIEQVMTEMTPPRKEYEVFQLQNADAYWVALNLKDFFEEDKDKGDDSRDRYYSWMFGNPSSSSGERDTSRQLAKRRPLKFVSDLDTNTILVLGADPEQLKTIAELIKLYDVPQPVSSQSMRLTKIFYIQYSKASAVAETIKDAYVDLLSSNDKSLAQRQQNQRPSSGMTYISNYGGGGEPAREERTKVTFKGKLSIGVDDLTNTLLVSAEGENLLKTIGEMIKELDEAAKPLSTMQVIQLDGGVSLSSVQQAISQMLGQTAPAAKPTQTPQRQPQRTSRPNQRPGRAAPAANNR